MKLCLRSLAVVAALGLLASGCNKKAGAAGAGKADAPSAKTPILIGITADASGQYANSGDSDKRGVIMAIE
jgi:branched-chain amino acid transport system substrate-binding protein